MITQTGTFYSIWLSTPAGVRIKLIDLFLRLEYVRVLNNVGVLKLALPFDFPLAYLQIDGRLEVWRHLPGGVKILDTETVWLIRDVSKRLAEDGRRYIEIIAYSAVELLRRRIVAYAAGSSQAGKTDPADDIMKAIVRENLGSLATDTARDLSAWLTVQADAGAGASVTKLFSRRRVLAVLQELAQASAEAGTPLFFDIVAPSVGSLEFRTFTGQRGIDHSASEAKPVVLSPASGTLTDVVRRFDYSSEENYIYTGGQGEEAVRTIVTASDSSRIALSPLNRCEGWVDARNTADSGLAAEAQAGLRSGRPRQVFSGKIVNTEAVQYGREWGFGDRVSGEFDGEVVDALIDKVQVVVENGAEDIRAGLKVEE